jgi:hypothetical protein
MRDTATQMQPCVNASRAASQIYQDDEYSFLDAGHWKRTAKNNVQSVSDLWGDILKNEAVVLVWGKGGFGNEALQDILSKSFCSVLRKYRAAYKWVGFNCLCVTVRQSYSVASSYSAVFNFWVSARQCDYWATGPVQTPKLKNLDCKTNNNKSVTDYTSFERLCLV